VTKRRQIFLDFEIDKLTNSIENILTGDSFSTDISIVTKEDIKAISKKAGWLQRGCDGYVSFIAKTKLIDHYVKTLGAVHLGAQRMVINTEASLKLIDKYFPK